MNFDNKTITYAGANLMAHSDAIKKATVIDSVIISSNSPSNNADFAKLSFDDFGSYQEYPVVNIRQNDNVFQPEAVISNEGFIRDFTLLMVGLKGHTEGEENSSIIAVAVDKSNSPFTIPKQTNVPYKLYLDLPIGYSNSNNVIMNVNNAGLVTMDDVDHAIKIAISALVTKEQYSKDVADIWSDAAHKEYKADHAKDIGSLNNRFDTYVSSADILQSNAVNNMTSLNNRFNNYQSSNDFLQSNAVNNMTSLNNRFNDYSSAAGILQSNAENNMASINNRFDSDESSANVLQSNAVNNMASINSRFDIDESSANVLQSNAVNNMASLNSRLTSDESSADFLQSNAVVNMASLNSRFVVNETSLNNISSSVSSNAVQIATNSSLISSNTNTAIQLSSNIGNMFQNRGVLTGDLFNVSPLLDGYYQLIGNTKNAPNGFSGYGVYIKQHAGNDNYVTLIQANNNIWQAHEYHGTWDLWVKLVNSNDIASLQNQINTIKSKLGM